jgi:hypothetical protein
MKSRKPPARKPGIVPYGVKIQILNWLLRGHPGATKDPKFLKNELRILKGLLLTYPSPSFWLSLRIPLDLNSLCFFLSQSGKQELEKKWRLHWFEKNQGKAQNPLDSIAAFPMIAEDLSFVDEPVKTRDLPPELSRRRISPIDWADSTSD